MESNRKSFFQKSINNYLIVNNKAKILDANESFLSLFEIKYDDLIQKNLSDLFNFDNDFPYSLHSLIRKNKKIIIREIFSPSIKRIFDISFFLITESIIGLEIEDVSERKRKNEQLQKIQRKIIKQNKFKEILLSNLNHELRTPLNGIIGYSQLLQLEITNPSQQKMANMIYQSGKRLLNTLNSILMLSELEGENLKINLDSIHLYSVVKSIVLAFEEICQSKGLVLNFKALDKAIFARIDEYLFFKIIGNILDNAIKFTERGQITIIIDSLVEEDKIFGLIKIIDTGIGISKNQMRYIYNAFRQGSEGLDRKYGGVGLGLTLSKKMIELLQGDIEIESELNKGTVVTLKLIGSYRPN